MFVVTSKASATRSFETNLSKITSLSLTGAELNPLSAVPLHAHAALRLLLLRFNESGPVSWESDSTHWHREGWCLVLPGPFSQPMAMPHRGYGSDIIRVQPALQVQTKIYC
jgi:hypothetical protein